MRRRKAFLFIFVCWGIIIALSSIWLLLSARESLIKFSHKVAEENIVYYPPRASIVDCNGKKVCYTEWIFFVRVPQKQKYKINDLSTYLELECIAEEDTLKCIIPKEKLSVAVKLCRKYRLQIRRHIVRRTAELPRAVKQKLGIVLLYCGLTGIESEYNKYLRGTPGVYQVIRSPKPLKNIEKDSLRILSPMRSGRKVKLKQSLTELRCGILPEVQEVL